MAAYSWLQTFYPYSALGFHDESKHYPEVVIEALERSILKWAGALAPQRRAHHVEFDHSIALKEKAPNKKRVLWFGAESCHLCRIFGAQDDCPECPITLKYGKPCDSQNPPGLWTRVNKAVPGTAEHEQALQAMHDGLVETLTHYKTLKGIE